MIQMMKPSLLLNFIFQRERERDIIPRLSEALQLPHKIVCCQETVANNMEAMCILLKRLYPSVSDTWYHFWGGTLQKFVIFNYILDYIYSKFNQLLSL